MAAHAADAWPTRDITFYVPYVPYAPGGAAERISRRYAELTEKQLKLRVIVENKPGASATPWQEASGRIWPQDIATVKVRPLSPCGRGEEKNKPYGSTSRRSLSCVSISARLSSSSPACAASITVNSSWASLSRVTVT